MPPAWAAAPMPFLRRILHLPGTKSSERRGPGGKVHLDPGRPVEPVSAARCSTGQGSPPGATESVPEPVVPGEIVPGAQAVQDRAVKLGIGENDLALHRSNFAGHEPDVGPVTLVLRGR